MLPDMTTSVSSWGSHGGRRKQIPKSCPLTSTRVMCVPHTDTRTQTYKINKMQLRKLRDLEDAHCSIVHTDTESELS